MSILLPTLGPSPEREGVQAVLLGIMSDSHGRYRIVRHAVELFDRYGVQMIVHCGDVGDLGVFDELAGRDCRFVWGNMDDPPKSVSAYLHDLGIPQPGAVPLEFQADGKRVLVFHGHERGMDKAIRSGRADYVLHGHTHQPHDERVGRTRVINPGALYRGSSPSVATLDTSTDLADFHVLAPLRKP